MARVIAIANQKGGVGKTTTAVNLAACLWALDQRVLVVDLDCQANATHWLGIDTEDTVEGSAYDVLLKEQDVRKVILPTVSSEEPRENFDLVPANIRLAAAEKEFPHIVKAEERLTMALEPIQDKYHYVVLDLPPSLSHCTLNGLIAADLVIFVFSPDPLALLGWDDMKDTLRTIGKYFRRSLAASALLCRYDPRQISDSNTLEQLRKEFPGGVLEPIPRSVSVVAAMQARLPLVECKPRSAPAQRYSAIAQEIVEEDQGEEQAERIRIVKG
jgi:chromosome partitioning protein